MITANALRDCIRSRAVGSERNHKAVTPVFPAWSMSALSTGPLTERLFEIPRLRWGLKGPPRWLIWLVIFLALALAVLHEMRTSALQSRLFSCWASHIAYAVAPGPSPNIVFPQGGPFDLRLGYSLIPDFQRRLEAKNSALRNRPGFRLSWSEQRAGGSHLLIGNLQAQGWQFAARRVWRSTKLPLPGTCFKPLIRFHH
jgi:hypothetical protein